MKKLLPILVTGLLACQAQAQERSISLGGFIQTQYSYSSYNGETQKSAFELKRARLDVEGNLNGRLSYRLLSEMAISPTVLDASISYRFSSAANIRVGQFKNPFSLANQLSPLEICSAEYLTPLSNYIGRPGSYSEGYDNGIMLSGSVIPTSQGYDLMSYSIALMNGGPINSRNDDNTDKNMTGRIDIRPLTEELTVSVSALKGTYSNASNGGSRYSGLERMGGGLMFNDSKLVFLSEFFIADTENWNGIESVKVKSNAWYCQANYWFPVGKNGRISPVLVYDYIDKNVNQSRDEQSNLVLGAECWPVSNFRLLANYRMTTDSSLTRYQHGFYAQAAVVF